MRTPIALPQNICKSATGLASTALPAARFVTYTGTEYTGGNIPIGMNTALGTYPESLHVQLPGVGGAGAKAAGVNYFDVLAGQAATVVTDADAVGVEIEPDSEADFDTIDLPVAQNAAGQAVLALAGDVIVGYTRSVARAGFGYTDENGAEGNNGVGTMGMFPFNGIEGPADTHYYVLVELSNSGNVVPAVGP